MPAYIIKSFEGGISQDPFRGLSGSFRYGYGLDIRGNADTLTCNQAMVKDSGTTVTDLILFFVSASDGNLYGFGDTGKIWKMTTSTGVWSLLDTYAGADAPAKIQGACEFTSDNGAGSYVPYLYYSTRRKLNRIPLSTGVSADDWQTLTNSGSTGWHCMASAVGTLQIGNLEDLAFVDYESGFTASGLDLQDQYIIKPVLAGLDDLVVFASQNTLWTWDRIQQSWIARRNVPESTINAMLYTTFIIIQAGNSLYYWDTSTLTPIRKLYGSDHSVLPGGMCNHDGMAYLAVNGTSNVGVYSWGKKKDDAVKPRAFNYDYILSHGKTSSVSVGGIVSHNGNLYVAWKDGTTYGVDKIDTSNKATARYESLIFRGDNALYQKRFGKIKVTMSPLPSGCSISCQYKMNQKASWTTAKVIDGRGSFATVGATKAFFKIDAPIEDGQEMIEIAFTLNPSSNTAPEILEIDTDFAFVGVK